MHASLPAVPPSRADLVLTGKVKQLEKNVSGAIVKIYGTWAGAAASVPAQSGAAGRCQ